MKTKTDIIITAVLAIIVGFLIVTFIDLYSKFEVKQQSQTSRRDYLIFQDVDLTIS